MRRGLLLATAALLVAVPAAAWRAHRAAELARVRPAVALAVELAGPYLVADARDTVAEAWRITVPDSLDASWARIRRNLGFALHARPWSDADTVRQELRLHADSTGRDTIAVTVAWSLSHRCSDGTWRSSTASHARRAVRSGKEWTLTPRGNAAAGDQLPCPGGNPVAAPRAVSSDSAMALEALLGGVLTQLRPRMVQGIADSVPLAWSVDVRHPDSLFAARAAAMLYRAVNAWDLSPADTNRAELTVREVRLRPDTAWAELIHSMLRLCDGHWIGSTTTVRLRSVREGRYWPVAAPLQTTTDKTWCE